MVRDGHGRHLEPSRAIHQAVDFTGAVEQAVISMEMKMDKVFGWHPANILTETAALWHAYVTSGNHSRCTGDLNSLLWCVMYFGVEG